MTRWAKQEVQSGRSKKMTWDHFSKPDKGHGIASFVQKMMTHPTNISVSGPTRILDLGCGGGTDIVAIQAALKAKVNDTLCLDVYPVKRNDVTPFLLDASSPSKYHESLAKALVGNENTVHVAISMVAFHHIPDPKMRKDALVFLRRVLHPGGIFIMAEWDNSIKPDRWIHYDLVHLLPNMLFSLNAPPKKSRLKMGTKYNSVKEWIAIARDSGLQQDEARSRAHGLSPQDQAALPGNANRDFHMVFGKGMELPKAVASPKYK
jgi:SAM-dependent methyltransferase